MRLIAKTVAFLCSVVILAASPLSAESLDQPLVLSVLSNENQNVELTSSKDGRRVFATWDGYLNGQRRIFLREQLDGIWLSDESIIDNEPAADNQSPSIDMDASGDYHIAWLARVGGKPRVFYTFRKAGIQVNWGPIDGGEAPDETCKSVNIGLDSDDKPWITWQSGSGSSVAIRCAHMDPSTGQFSSGILTPDAKSYNLYPEIFFSPAPMVSWYSDAGGEVLLMSSRYSADKGWEQYDVENLEKLETDRFPFLFQNSRGILAALWTGEIASRDSILLGMQDAETKGQGNIVSQGVDAMNDFLSGTASGNQFVAVWRSWTVEKGAQICLSHGEQIPFTGEMIVSDGEPLYYSRPRATPLSGGVAVAWQSNSSDGGDGRIYFRKLTF